MAAAPKLKAYCLIFRFQISTLGATVLALVAKLFTGACFLAVWRTGALQSCGARPSEGRRNWGEMALWGKARRWRAGWFSRRYCVGLSSLLYLGGVNSSVMKRWVEGMRSARPDCEAVLMPRHNMVMRGQWNARWPNGGMPRSSQGFPYGRAEPAPPRHGQPQLTGLVGNDREEREGHFLGGAHSVRPQRRARRRPGHSISTGCLGKGSVA